MSERARNIVRAFNVDHAGNRVGNVIDLLEELMDKAIEEAVAAETERCVKFVWERGDALHELSGRGHLVNDAKFTAGRELIAAAQALRARKP